MVYVEPSFPRGRKVDNDEDQKPRKKFKKSTDYGAATTNEEKPQKLRPKERQQARLGQIEQDREELEQSVNAAPLLFKSAQEGMLLMGSIFKITKMDIKISLPGRLYGSVPILSVSEAYTKRLQNLLQNSLGGGGEQCPGLDELYQVGDIVCVKIKSKFCEDKRFGLTLDPKELHSEFGCKYLVEGLVLTATVEEEEDHGYQMNVGIKNVRAFLPTHNVNNNKMIVGRNLFCAVEKVTQAKGSATVVLKAFKPTEPRKLEVAQINIDALVPGSVVTFNVESILRNGLQGTLFDDTVPAFVNENMLEKPLSSIKNYGTFKQVQARILYVMPLSKHVFLTLANFDSNRVSVAEPVAPGRIIQDAKIIYKCPSGVWFQVGKKHKALLPRYILKSKYNQNYDEQIVMAKYQIGSVHKIRVMRYEAFDRTLIVTDDEKSIDTKYFTLADLKVGDIYNCRITKVLDKNRGYLVSLDNIKGIVTGFNFDSSKMFAVNQMMKMRLIAIDEERRMAQFSNHPAYLKKTAKLIISREDLKSGNEALGTVVSEQEKYFLVAFGNRIKAILFKFCRAVPQDQTRIALLKPGIVERFTIHEVSENGEKITVTIPLHDGDRQTLQHAISGTITGLYATGADIYLVKENETGTVPPEMFSDFPSHNSIYAGVLKEGEQLKVVNVKENVYSCRDVDYFRRKPTHIKDVKLGQVLRAYCVEVAPSGKKISFQLALKDYHRRIWLKMRKFADRGEQVSIEVGQVILVKVVRSVKKPDGRFLVVSPKLKDVCSNDVEDPIRYMQSYLDDVKQLLKRFKSRDKAFAQYTIGQSVTCVVESFIDESDQMVVRLGDGEDTLEAKGIATKDPKRDADSYSPGDLLEARVLWVDVEKQLVYLCVVKKYLKHLTDKDQNQTSKELLQPQVARKFVTLFQNEYVAVGCLSKVDCPLVIVPVRCHYNELRTAPAVANKVNVLLQRISDGLLLGLTEQTYDRFKDFIWTPPERKDKSDKMCWLPDDYEEPILEDPEEWMNDDNDNSDDGNAEIQSDSGIDKDGDTEELDPVDEEPEKESKKKKKKATKLSSGNILKLKKSDTVASPAKKLKVKKEKNKTAAKKMKAGKEFVISQLDGADDSRSKHKKQGKKNKNKNHFLSERPTANALHNSGSMQSGPVRTSQTQLEKKDKLHQLAQQTKFKKKNTKASAQAIKTITELSEPTKKAKKISSTEKLPGAHGFWGNNPSTRKQDSDSSDDDEQPETQIKKRLNAKERFEAMKQEEKRIRQIEDELADASVDPHTPDQFDRQVLAQPNSSLLWIRYMVFHMESAEVEKARAVARRALKTINFREEGERLNIWIALLNLELRYETVDRFKEVLHEAIQYNDAFKVYSRVIEIVIDCGKVPEAQDIIDILQKRFRKESEMWLLVAGSYYKMGQAVKVKPLLSKALKSLENKEHIPLIVKFAFLHNRNGERDEAHLLFEQILTSYPKRTDIWSQYVDILVKDGLIDVARQTLDRAIAQRLPMKNMKTLYTKYVAFEEKHGTRAAVKRIKQAATDYVQKQLGSLL